MKRLFFITSMLACAMMLATPASAQEENGFQKFNVVENFADNGFQWLRDAQLLAAGSKNDGSHSPGANAMTIGWGAIGTLWQRTALTVYVAEKRYTKEFMDQNEYFTVMTFDVADSKVLGYMGQHSGRDGDKAKALVCILPIPKTEHPTTPKPRWSSSVRPCMPPPSTRNISRVTYRRTCTATSLPAFTRCISARW